ncbi:unnamed protein product [Tilletia laevis]|uniref:Uncharacterized protein n=1 Tax=Tilletia laevis TaxID=157183 RepID=A0A9N8M1K6_9BASI|nr:unnamed protein product [Tilletia laevis]
MDPVALPIPPPGPTAGSTPSQALEVHDTQSQPLNDYEDLINLPDFMDTADSVPPADDNSQPLSGRSDSPTPSSHLDDDSQDVAMHQDTTFINDDSQQPPENSQLPGEAASLSQEIAALSPAGSLSATRIQRPPPGTYAEQNNDDADYEDTSDDDDESDPPSVVTPNLSSSSQTTAGALPTVAATPSAATNATETPAPGPASSGSVTREVETGFVAHRFNRSTVPGHPVANAFASITLEGNGTIPTTILAPPRCGLPLSPRYIPAKVIFANCSDDEEAVAIFQDSFARTAGVFVIEAWSIH